MGPGWRAGALAWVGAVLAACPTAPERAPTERSADEPSAMALGPRERPCSPAARDVRSSALSVTAGEVMLPVHVALAPGEERAHPCVIVDTTARSRAWRSSARATRAETTRGPTTPFAT